MDFKEIIKIAEEFAIPYYDKYENYPDFWSGHVCLVRKYCQELAEIEGGDKEILDIAAILHDIGKYKDKENHHIIGVEMTKEFLKDISFPDNKKELILRCILKHRTKYSNTNNNNNNINVKIIQSADALATLFDNNWQTICRKNKSKEELLRKYDKTFNKIVLDSAKRIAKPQAERLKELLN
jgi:putative nucleotidyltransferase with HDIG domain